MLTITKDTIRILPIYYLVGPEDEERFMVYTIVTLLLKDGTTKDFYIQCTKLIQKNRLVPQGETFDEDTIDIARQQEISFATKWLGNKLKEALMRGYVLQDKVHFDLSDNVEECVKVNKFNFGMSQGAKDLEEYKEQRKYFNQMTEEQQKFSSTTGLKERIANRKPIEFTEEDIVERWKEVNEFLKNPISIPLDVEPVKDETGNKIDDSQYVRRSFTLPKPINGTSYTYEEYKEIYIKGWESQGYDNNSFPK